MKGWKNSAKGLWKDYKIKELGRQIWRRQEYVKEEIIKKGLKRNAWKNATNCLNVNSKCIYINLMYI